MANAALAHVDSVDRYVGEIARYRLITREQEVELAHRYRSTGDVEAAHQLVVSNLRFVVKVAHEYRGYGLKLLDLIQEGNIGLMMAVKKFDPAKGYRLISYAVWWIRAYIQNYVIRSWSLVKVGTTQAQRKLFFKLRSERERADRESTEGERATTSEIADRLGVKETNVIDMEMRMAARDFSLDGQLEPGARQTHLDMLPDATPTPGEQVADEQERRIVRGKVDAVMRHMNDKERFIIENRLMTDEPMTLHDIGANFGISRERARQIEGNVIRKMRKALDGYRLEERLAA